MIPVSAEEQREALRFINDNLWSSEPFRFEPELVNMLGRESQWGFDWLALISGTRDFDVHDWILMIQSEPFYWLYDAMVLERVLNNELRMPDGGEAFTLVELFETVRACIWMEVADRTSIDSYRRNLQRAHLEMIAGIMLDPAYGTPEDAITLARNDLLVLAGPPGA